MTKKHLVKVILLITIIFSASTIVPSYLSSTVKGMVKIKEDEISLKDTVEEHIPKSTIDSLFPNATIEKTTMSIGIDGIEGNLDITRYKITAQNGTKHLKIGKREL